MKESIDTVYFKKEKLSTIVDSVNRLFTGEKWKWKIYAKERSNGCQIQEMGENTLHIVIFGKNK